MSSPQSSGAYIGYGAMLGGRLGDILGHKGIVTIGIILFAVAFMPKGRQARVE